MERSSFATIFAIRESKIRKNGKTPIEVTITVNGQRCSFSTGKNVQPENWDSIKQEVKGKNEEAKALNKYLKTVKTILYNKESELLERGFIITADLLRNAYFDKVDVLKEKSLFNVFEEHNEQQKAMIGNGISKATHWCSEYTLRLCKDYLTEKFQRKDIYLRELNINFIKDFHIYLLKRMKQNTCSKHLKLLKKIINISVANSYMSFNPFAPYKVERTSVEIEFLNEEELRQKVSYHNYKHRKL